MEQWSLNQTVKMGFQQAGEGAFLEETTAGAKTRNTHSLGPEPWAQKSGWVTADREEGESQRDSTARHHGRIPAFWDFLRGKPTGEQIHDKLGLLISQGSWAGGLAAVRARRVPRCRGLGKFRLRVAPSSFWSPGLAGRGPDTLLRRLFPEASAFEPL